MNLKFVIFTKNDFNNKIFKDFLKRGIEGGLKLDKFDYKEPTKIKINDLDEIMIMLADYGNIILKGVNKSVLTSRYSDQFPTVWRGHFKLNVKGFSITEIISLIETLSNDQILFGGIYTEDEFDLKHKIVDQYSYTWKGVSPQDFMNHIPGIYWYTIFGKELVQAIGEEKFQNLSDVVYTKPGNGCVAFHLNEPIESNDLESRISKEKELVDAIGKQYFFDKDENYENSNYPKAFLEVLRSL